MEVAAPPRSTVPRLAPGLVGAFSGGLLALCLQGPALGLLTPVALVPLVAACLGARLGRAALEGWSCGLFFFGLGFAWALDLRGPITVSPGAYAVGIAVLALAMAGFALGVAWLARRAGPVPALVSAPGLWVAFEWLRSEGPLAVPWLRIGSVLAEWPLLVQMADLGGVLLLSGWLVAIGSTLVAGVLLHRAGAAPLLLALVAAPVLYGAHALDRFGGHAAGAGDRDRVRIAAVQPNIAEEERHDRALFDRNLRRLITLSRVATPGEVDLVVWPESAYERPIREGDPFLAAIANDLGRPLLTGVFRIPDRREPTLRNSVALAIPGGETRAVADKVHPVPIFESAPPEALRGALAGSPWWVGRTRAGPRPRLASIPRDARRPLRAGVLICNDASHSDASRALRLAGAEVLVAVYNEAQAGREVARQGELFARLRAVENRTPVVRVANTGRSVWIDRDGRVLRALPPDAETSGVATLRTAGSLSVYARCGDGPTLALALLVPVAVGLRPARRSRIRDHELAGPLIQPEPEGEPS